MDSVNDPSSSYQSYASYGDPDEEDSNIERRPDDDFEFVSDSEFSDGETGEAASTQNTTQHVDILNIFMVYYKNLFQKDTDATMFHDIDYSKSNSTNRAMELFYDHVCKYKQHEDDEIKASIYLDKPDINDWTELYILTIDGEDEKYCQFLVPLLSYLASKDWVTNKWSIIPLKTDDEV